MDAMSSITFLTYPVFALTYPNVSASGFNIIFIFRIPQNYQIIPLYEKHAEYIHSFWPYEFENSCEYIRSMILLNGGLGIFDTNNNELLCWIITNDNFALG